MPPWFKEFFSQIERAPAGPARPPFSPGTTPGEGSFCFRRQREKLEGRDGDGRRLHPLRRPSGGGCDGVLPVSHELTAAQVAIARIRQLLEEALIRLEDLSVEIQTKRDARK